MAEDRNEGARSEPDAGRPVAHGPWQRLTLILALAVMLGGGALLVVYEPTLLPIRVVSVEGRIVKVAPAELQRTVVGALDGGILSQGLKPIQEALEALPWVRRAGVTRVWPDRLILEVHEQVAVARWGDDGLVSGDGIVFRPSPATFPTDLVRLDGEDRQAPEVVARYLAWREPVGDLGAGLAIDSLSRDARGAWTLHCMAASGYPVEVALGRNQASRRIERFLSSYPTLVAVGYPARVDMRYSNGLAVRWHGENAVAARVKRTDERS